MNRRIPTCAGVLSLLMLMACCSRGAPRESLQRRPGYRCEAVGLEDGVWIKGRSFWQDVPGEMGKRLRFQPKDIFTPKTRAFAGYYLNYNHRQEDSQVLLTRESGPGTEWRIEEADRKKNSNGFGYRIFTRIKPSNGPMKDWFLSVKDDQFVLSKDGVPAPIYAEIDDLNDGK